MPNNPPSEIWVHGPGRIVFTATQTPDATCCVKYLLATPVRLNAEKLLEVLKYAYDSLTNTDALYRYDQREAIAQIEAALKLCEVPHADHHE